MKKSTQREAMVILGTISYVVLGSYWLVTNYEKVTGLHSAAIMIITAAFCVLLSLFYWVAGDDGAGRSMRGDPPTL